MNVSQAVTEVISSSQLYSEALNTGIANVSSIARQIQQKVVRLIGSDVSEPAIIMAIKRLPPDQTILLDKSIDGFMEKLGDITVRSDLIDLTYVNSLSLTGAQQELLSVIRKDDSLFYSSCKGVHETTIVSSSRIQHVIEDLFAEEELISKRVDLAAVSVMLPPSNLETHGIYYVFLKRLAWRRINIVEILSTSHEISLVVDAADVQEVFGIILDLKRG